LRHRGAAPTFAAAPHAWEYDFVTADQAIQCCARLTPENRKRELRGLVAECGACHGPEDAESGFRIDLREQAFADGSGDSPPNQPLWSGFRNAGAHRLGESTRLFVVGGAEPAAVTADVVIFEEQESADDSGGLVAHLRGRVTAGENVDAFPPLPAKFVRFTVRATNSAEPCIDELEVLTPSGRNVARGAKPSSSGDYDKSSLHTLAHVNDGIYGNKKSWISNQIGGGWIQLELPEVEEVSRVVWTPRPRGRPRPPDPLPQPLQRQRIDHGVLMRNQLSHAGRHLLERRAFLQWGGTGLSGIALTALLHEQRLVAGEPPIRPAFVAIPDPRGVPQIGPRQWQSAFLPAVFQGTPFNADKPIANLARPASIPETADLATRDFLRLLNDDHLARHPGETDDFGYKAVKDVTTIYDLHAAIPHLLGLDHTRLSFYNNGIERRLTDVHGHVIEPILA